jgi:hypothetical protein
LVEQYPPIARLPRKRHEGVGNAVRSQGTHHFRLDLENTGVRLAGSLGPARNDHAPALRRGRIQIQEPTGRGLGEQEHLSRLVARSYDPRRRVDGDVCQRTIPATAAENDDHCRNKGVPAQQIRVSSHGVLSKVQG